MQPKTDNIANYDTSLDKLVLGVNKVCDVIKPTYGPAGSNVVIEESLKPGHRVANDGKLITDAIWLSDPIEQIGANILREVCEKQEKEAGDGRKTTIILTAAILNEGLKYVRPTSGCIIAFNDPRNWFERKLNLNHYKSDKAEEQAIKKAANQPAKIKPLELKRQLDECLPIIIKSIDEQKKDITPDEVGSIARTASESEELGRLIGEIYPKIGRDGIIEIDTSNLPNTYYEVVDGVRIRAGWFGGYWQTEEGKCVLNNPKILITKDKITSVEQLNPLYKSLSSEGVNELVIYCEDIDLAVASRLALTSVNGKFKTLIIKAPVLWKDWIYEDFALMTGAKPVDSKMGQTFKLLTTEHLGTCAKLVCTDNETRVIGVKDMTAHVEKLNEKAKVDDQQALRASWLNTKVAVLKVGANSESELSWKIKKAKDACHASYYALKDGVVNGAGLSLGSAALKLFNPNALNTASFILKVALPTPSNQIIENMGGPLKAYLPNDIIDPAIVVKSAITNAISIAGIILTTKGAITIPIELKEAMMKMQTRLPN